MADTAPNFKTDAATKVYAKALIELAEEQGKLDAVAGEVESLREMLGRHARLRRLLETPALTTADRAGVIDRVFKGQVSDTLYKFLQVVNRKGRLGSLGGITQSFAGLLAERMGVVEVEAYVAKAMDAGQAGRVSDGLARALDGKRVNLKQHVDPSLIGGLKLRIGDRLLDASVANQLKLIRQRLVEKGREQARQKTFETADFADDAD